MHRLWVCLLVACRIGFDPQMTVTPEQGRRALALGDDHGCTIRDNDIYCWGLNNTLQVGDPEPGVRLTPRAVPDLPAIPIAITAGGGHTCFLSVDEEVYCWGGNEAGQAGPRTDFVDSAAVVRVTGLPPQAVDIAAGAAHTCSVHRDGTVWCWGDGRDGQAGPKRLDTQLPPQQVVGVTGAVHVAAGGNTTCALLSGGAVTCWGLNDNGQLGDATMTSRAEPKSIEGLTASAIGLGEHHVCALNLDGAYQCWGQGYYGELGDGALVVRTVPNPPSPQRGLIGIDGGTYFTCAVDGQGVVSCWGHAYHGQVGNGFRIDTALAPLAVSAGGPIAAVSLGSRTACALRRDGEVVCWGFGAQGQVGDGRASVVVPAKIPLAQVRMIAAGEHDTCALHGPVASETVSCWGDNRSSVAGSSGDIAVAPTPIMRAWVGNVIDLKVGGHFGCVRATGGHLWCWGDDSVGSLGDGTLNTSAVPRHVGTDTFAAFATMHLSGCGVRTADSAVLCWGSNYYGELGNGVSIDRMVPTPVLVAGSPLSAVDVVAGSYHACARDSSGEVLCWGSNRRLETGGSEGTDAVITATQVALPAAATELRGGGGSTCVRYGDNSITCWGNNDFGLLDEAAQQYALPTRIARTELGYFGETLACDSGGNCWGDDRLGQLGDGSLVPRYTSAPVALPGSPTMVAVGYHHACALVDGAAYCWGDNPQGQVGNGSSSNAYSPVKVTFP